MALRDWVSKPGLVAKAANSANAVPGSGKSEAPKQRTLATLATLATQPNSESKEAERIEARPAEPYAAADLAEMDRLLGELAALEDWREGELEARLDERRRMAPVNVQNALQALRAAAAAALAGWPEPPLERAQIALCRLVN